MLLKVSINWFASSIEILIKSFELAQLVLSAFRITTGFMRGRGLPCEFLEEVVVSKLP